MEKNKNNEEIQSRRDFFKKAAKGALPILGVAILASTPILVQAKDVVESNGCNDSCERTCRIGCDQSCHNIGCKGSCHGACDGTCKGGCEGGCRGDCTSSNY